MPKTSASWRTKLKLILPAIILSAFFALAGKAEAATYYVKNGGNDSAAGTSDAAAWATIAKVNNTAINGDSVYFKCGGTWTGTVLTIDWSGASATNLSVVGAYHMNGSTPVHGVSGSKPKINGVWHDTIAKRVPNAFPAALIKVAGQKSHIRIENIRAEDSAGLGMDSADGDDIHFLNCEVYHSYNGGMRFSNTINSSMVGCLIERAGAGVVDRFPEDTNTNRPAVLGIVNSCANILVKGNTLRTNYGEGIGVYHGGHNWIVENNIIYDQMWISIYTDRSWDGIIRYNLIYGIGANNPQTTLRAGGIGVNVEPTSNYNSYVPGYPESPTISNVFVYGNFISRAGKGIGVTGGNPYYPYIISNIKVFNNTVIDSTPAKGVTWANNYMSGAFGIPEVATFSGVEFRNNISLCISAGCRHSEVTPRAGITWDRNFWGTTGSIDPGSIGTNDPVRADLTFAKTTGWTNLAAGSVVPNDFKLPANSPAINKGVAIPNPSPVPGQPEVRFNLDYFGTLRPQGAGWDIGAHEYVVSDITAPGTPVGLVVR